MHIFAQSLLLLSGFLFVLSGDAAAASENVLNPQVVSKVDSAESVFHDYPRKMYDVYIEIDAGKTIGTVNRRLYGICMVRPPFGPGMAEDIKPWLKGGSVRIWPNIGPGDEEFDMAGYWSRVMEVVKKTKPAWVMAWAPHCGVPPGTYYKSMTDNNMPKGKRPQDVAEYVRWVNKTPHPGFPDGYNVLNWEIWNEPEYNPITGFAPEQYAQYVIDCSRLMREVDPRIKMIGAFLPSKREENGVNGGDAFMQYITKHAPKAIDFIDNHFYNGCFWETTEQYGSYLGRVGYSEHGIKEYYEETNDRVKRYGDYKIVCSEWNVHHPIPNDWKNIPQTHRRMGHDLAAAVYAGAVLIQWMGAERLYAAEFFDLSNRDEQFAMFKYIDANTPPIKYPTFYTMDLFGKYFNGDRLSVKVLGDKFRMCIPKQWKMPWEQEFEYVVAAAASDANTICLMLVNREPTKPLRVNVNITHAEFWKNKKIEAVCHSLTGDDPETTEARVDTSRRTFVDGLGPEGTRYIVVPPHSVNAILIPLK